jgi:hypothetical protein
VKGNLVVRAILKSWSRGFVFVVPAALLGAGACSSQAPQADDNASNEVAASGDAWGPRIELRDDTALYSESSPTHAKDFPEQPDPASPDKPDPNPGWRKPEGGWYVAPIHVTLLSTGKVLVTGWGRRWHHGCGHSLPSGFYRYEGGRNHGVSLVLDTTDLDRIAQQIGGAHKPPRPAPKAPSPTCSDGPDICGDAELVLSDAGQIASMIVDENPNPRFHPSAPLASNATFGLDTLYCAGHASMSDGKVLLAGGARYALLGQRPGQAGGEIEDGLNYGRVFDPGAQTFTATGAMQGGQAPAAADTTSVEHGARWYPTVTRLANGKLLVGGGFWGYRPGDEARLANPTLDVYDPTSGFEEPLVKDVAASALDASHLLDPGIRDYSHTFLLPHPKVIDGVTYDVLSVGSQGTVVLISTQALDGDAAQRRFLRPPNGERPGGVTAEDSTSALVSTSRGERILVMGGTTSVPVAKRADLYDPVNDAWEQSRSTPVARRNHASVLLPDGTVLLTNGYDGGFGVGGKLGGGKEGVMRAPVVLDPDTGNAVKDVGWNESLDRGYHSFALLLSDGRVLVGGGIQSVGGAPYDIGCERSDIRIYTPPYLRQKKARPVVPDSISAGQSVVFPLNVDYTGPALRDAQKGGVVLMAPGSFTHGFDQNQRYVKLTYTKNGSTLTISRGDESEVVPPGGYFLYFVSADGVPSVGKYVELH